MIPGESHPLLSQYEHRIIIETRLGKVRENNEYAAQCSYEHESLGNLQDGTIVFEFFKAVTRIAANVIEVELEGKVVSVLGVDDPAAVFALEDIDGSVLDEFVPALPADGEVELCVVVIQS